MRCPQKLDSRYFFFGFKDIALYADDFKIRFRALLNFYRFSGAALFFIAQRDVTRTKNSVNLYTHVVHDFRVILNLLFSFNFFFSTFILSSILYRRFRGGSSFARKKKKIKEERKPRERDRNKYLHPKRLAKPINLIYGR